MRRVLWVLHEQDLSRRTAACCIACREHTPLSQHKAEALLVTLRLRPDNSKVQQQQCHDQKCWP